MADDGKKNGKPEEPGKGKKPKYVNDKRIVDNKKKG